MAFQKPFIQLLPSIHGKIFGLDKNNHLIIEDRVAVANPRNPHPQCVHFDDFLGDLIGDEWEGLAGSDAQALAPAITVAENGVVRCVGGDSGASVAADASQLSGELNFQADAGNLVFEARFKLSAIVTVQMFIGLTDANGALEVPIHSAGSANTITTNASDAVGVFFDTQMTDDNFWLAGVDTNVDATHVDSSVAPVAATYNKVRIEVDASGDARFYIDDNWIADVDSCVTPTVALCPVAVIRPLSTSSVNLDIDYIHVSQDRG